ncbi:MAG: hypothetical protein LBL72_09065 [Candidatus Accumulibacter sp.]|nr:hypothetical protein [Accumulibacter sp.]
MNQALRTLELQDADPEEKEAALSIVTQNVAALDATPTEVGTLAVSGTGARAAVKAIAPEARILQRSDGAIVVDKASAPAVQDAISNARTIWGREQAKQNVSVTFDPLTSKPARTPEAAVPGPAPAPVEASVAPVQAAQSVPAPVSPAPSAPAPAAPVAPEQAGVPVSSAAAPQAGKPSRPLRQRKQTYRRDLVGDLIELGGISPVMALDLTGDTAFHSHLPGLFRKSGTEDLSDLSDLLNNSGRGWNLSTDGNELAELIRRASDGERIASPEVMEEEHAAALEAEERDRVRKSAEKLNRKLPKGKKIRTRGVKFAEIDARVDEEMARRREDIQNRLAQRDERTRARFLAAMEEARSLLPEKVLKEIEERLLEIPGAESEDSGRDWTVKALQLVKSEIRNAWENFERDINEYTRSYREEREARSAEELSDAFSRRPASDHQDGRRGETERNSQSDEGEGSQQPTDFGLSSQSAAEARAQAEARDKADAKDAPPSREQVDREREAFSLSGESQPSNDRTGRAAAGGTQSELFTPDGRASSENSSKASGPDGKIQEAGKSVPSTRLDAALDLLDAATGGLGVPDALTGPENARARTEIVAALTGQSVADLEAHPRYRFMTSVSALEKLLHEAAGIRGEDIDDRRARFLEVFDARGAFQQAQSGQTPEDSQLFQSGDDPFQPDAYDAREFADAVERVAAMETAPLTDLMVGDTPAVLRAIGTQALPIQMGSSLIHKASRPEVRGHEVPVDVLKNLPYLLADPVMVFDSSSEADGLVVLVEAKDEKGFPVIVTIHLDSKGAGFLRVNRITSVYGKDNTAAIQNWMNGKLRYYNQEKASSWLRASRLQLPGANTLKRLNPKLITDADIQASDFRQSGESEEKAPSRLRANRLQSPEANTPKRLDAETTTGEDAQASLSELPKGFSAVGRAVAEQLGELNIYPEEQVVTYAAMIDAFYKALATRVSVPIEEVWKKYPLSVKTSVSALEGGGFFGQTPSLSPAQAEVAAWRNSLDTFQRTLRNASQKGPLSNSQKNALPPARMKTPAALRYVGEKNRTLTLSVAIAEKIQEKHPDVPADVFQNLPALLHDPLYVYPHTDGGVNAVIDAVTEKGEPIVVGVRDGRITTVMAVNDTAGKKGIDVLRDRVEAALRTRPGEFVKNTYARNLNAENDEAPPRSGASVAAPVGTDPLRMLFRNRRNVVQQRKLVNDLGENFYQSQVPVFQRSANDPLIEASKRYFGVTTNPREAGYVLPDGTLLNLSGKHQASGDTGFLNDQREVDHGDLRGENKDGFSMADLFETRSNSLTAAMYEFMARTGAVRVDFNASVAAAIGEVTDAQIQALSRGMRWKGIMLDAVDFNYRIVAGADIENASPLKIRRFFESVKGKEAPPGAPYFQDESRSGASSGPRGSFDPKRGIISLFQSLNKSTFLHESGHAFLTLYENIIAEALASGTPLTRGRMQIQSDFLAVIRWAGFDGSFAEWRKLSVEQKRPYHEAFAKGFEAYLREGNAPTPQLKGVFERFRDWLREVYASFKDLGLTKELTPEVREIMGRMLTTEGDANADVASHPLSTNSVVAQNTPSGETQTSGKAEDALPGEETQSFKDTEKAYGGKKAFEQAKAAGKTKLDYRQWVQVRTPEFKAWFGDWEALGKQNEFDALVEESFSENDPRGKMMIRDVTPEEVSEILRQGGPDVSGMAHEISAEELRHAMKRHGDADEAAKNPGHRQLSKDDLKLVLAVIDAPTEITVRPAGQNRSSIIYGRDFGNGKIEYVERIFETSNKNKPRLTTRTVWVRSAATGAVTSPPRVSTPYRNSTVLFSGGRVNPDTVSKVVDEETGEPRVVYHGTDTDFSKFDLSRARQNADIPAFFFSSNVEEAQEYGRVGSYFLSIRNLKEGKPLSNMQGRKVRDELVAQDFDGTVDEEEWSTEYAAFSPNQIKSATGNNGAFSQENDDIYYQSDTPVANPAAQPSYPSSQVAPPIRWEVELPDTALGRMMDWRTIQLTDQYVDLKNIIEAINKTGKAIDERFNPYSAENRMHAKMMRAIQAFEENEEKPVVNAMRVAGISVKELSDFLIARHAPERNAAMKNRNPNRGELDALILRTEGEYLREITAGRYKEATPLLEKLKRLRAQNPFSGTEKERSMLSGMSDADARKILETWANDKRGKSMEAIAKMIDEIIAGTRALALAYGLETPGTILAAEEAYEYYVPLLRDLEEAELAAAGLGMGDGLGVSGSMVKAATGSRKEIENVFANVLNARESVIARGEKNLVMKSLYGLVMDNPNPELWATIRPEMSVQRIRKQLAESGATTEEINDLLKDVTKRTIDPITGLAKTMLNSNWKHLPNAVLLRLDGEDRVILFNRKSGVAMRLALILNGRGKELAFVSSNQLFDLMGIGTRWLGGVNTQYSPVFGIVNFVRDIQSALINISDTELDWGKSTKDILTSIYAARGALWAEARGKEVKGEMAQYLKEFMDSGAETGYRDALMTIEQRVKAIEQEMLGKGVRNMTGVKQLLDFVSDTNGVVENATRLAVFVAARKQGLSKIRAADIAKDVTVNFNRRGLSSGTIANMYMFFNASAQGIEKTIRVLSGPRGKRIILGGLAVGVLQALLGYGAGDDEWDDTPEYEKSKNFIIPVKVFGIYPKIPMPLGLNVLPNIGRNLTEMAIYHNRFAERSINLALSIFDSFNPLGGQSFTGMIMPSVLDPFVELKANEDGLGRPIYKENYNSRDKKPGHALARDDTGIIWKKISEGINLAFGGNKDNPGRVSPQPEAIRYLFGTMMGGMGRDMERAWDFGVNWANDVPTPVNRIPLLSRFALQPDSDAAVRRKYSAAVEQINQAENRVQGQRSRGEKPEADTVRIGSYARLARMYARNIARLRKLRDRTKDTDARAQYEARILDWQRRTIELLKKKRAAVIEDDDEDAED